jgi:hypothetical protein
VKLHLVYRVGLVNPKQTEPAIADIDVISAFPAHGCLVYQHVSYRHTRKTHYIPLTNLVDFTVTSDPDPTEGSP